MHRQWIRHNGRLVLATLAHRYRMHLVPGRSVGLESIVTLRPKHGIWVVPEARKAPPA
jgi:hypothetical protein